MENWKASPLAPDHVQVSNLGRVKTLDRLAPAIRDGKSSPQLKLGKILSPWLARNGYLMVSIKEGSARPKYTVHRLVAAAFCDGFDVNLSVNHINCNRLDNRADNLEWVTIGRNVELQWQTGNAKLRGDDHPGRKIGSDQAKQIRSMRMRGVAVAAIASQFCISQSLVYRIASRTRWASV